MSFPAYPEYKDSGVAWLGAVPSHWEVARLKLLLTEIDERAEERQFELLGLSKSLGVVRRSELSQGASESDNYGKYKVADTGNLVMNKMQAWNGVFGLAPCDGIVSPDYSVFRVTDERQAAFLCGLLRTDILAGELFTRCRGMGTAFLRLNTSDFFDVKIALPPQNEIVKIQSFLDRETAKIDALVAEQERLIALLKEKRQAVISHAVTKGLNPRAPMKDSGIEWLGEIPAHWEVAPLKYLVTFRSGGTPSKENPEFWNGEVPWASAKDLKVEILNDTIDHLTQHAIDERVASLLPAGAVVVLVRGMMLARLFPVCELGTPMTINQDLKALLAGDRIQSSYLAWTLRGTADETLNRLDEAGHGTKALRMEAWTSMELPLPPLDEQSAIAAHLSSMTREIDQLSAEAQSAIALLQERRAALISAAVTGKIDVRGLVEPSSEMEAA